MRKTTLCKVATELSCKTYPLILKIFFWPISGKDFERFFKWFGKSTFPQALSLLKYTLARKYQALGRQYRILTTSCRWVSEDDPRGSNHTIKQIHKLKIYNESKYELDTKCIRSGSKNLPANLIENGFKVHYCKEATLK